MTHVFLISYIAVFVAKRDYSYEGRPLIFVDFPHGVEILIFRSLCRKNLNVCPIRSITSNN